MQRVRPKKFLGQHFLTDLSVASDIADTVDACPNLPVLEVGPGMGVMTQYLVRKNRPLKVVEIDFESVEYLRKNFPQLEDSIIEDDFLKMHLEHTFASPQAEQQDNAASEAEQQACATESADNEKGNRTYAPGSFVLTGNYPYNISSQIFFKMLDYKHLIPCCTGMIQKEVAERIAAKPGTKAYGILSVLIQAWYSVEYLFTVHEHVFNPPPKVKSAVIRMTRNDVQQLGCDESLFRRIVKTTFNQRRKTLRNNIRPLLQDINNQREQRQLPAVDFAPLLQDELFNLRPEQLSVGDFIALTQRIDALL
ncbi:MAG: ribosomal RNA small subunit methyltransferase A [Bacteroidales bacterium]|nr:ribosomal RNA small subunit methyltransferase A [Candidatus Physcousia equi]